jgi:CO/xanthine dehydrogenase Mo-binding subunit
MGDKQSSVGKSIPFIGGVGKVTGKSQYLDDLEFSGMLYAKILRSVHPHAKILKIDTSRAEVLPGVRAVLTSDDCPNTRFGLDLPDTTILPEEKVRYVGEEVAAVAADTEKIAEHALELIHVEYEPLPAFFDTREKIGTDAILIHEDKPENIARVYQFERNDFQAAIEKCDHVFEEEFSTSRVTACYMEPFGVIASWSPDNRLSIETGTQAIFQTRAELAKALDMPTSMVTVNSPTIGGAFGAKIWLRNFQPIAALLAKKAGRPVKYVMTRKEEFLASRPRVPAIIKVRMGMMNDGTMICKDMNITADNGAYSWAAPKVMLNMAMRTDCLYRYEASRCKAQLIYTNTTPTSGMRGYGNTQGHYAVESMIDLCSRRLGLDPLEVRLKNAVYKGYKTLHGWNLRSCELSRCLEKTGEGIRANRAPKEDLGGRIKRGIGVACMTHVSGNRGGNNFDGSSSMLRFHEDGKLCLYHGESDMGQGASTVLAQIAAETLGISVDDIRIMPLSTDTSPFCFGSYSSRVTTVAGKAARQCAIQLKKQLLEVVAENEKINIDDLDIADGIIFYTDNKKEVMSVAKACQIGIRTKTTAALTSYIAYDPPTTGADPKTFYGDYSSAYTYAAQGVEVEIDTETGQIKILRVVCAHDLGKAINPKGVMGQIYGGIAQGAGYGIYENIVYEEGVLKTKSLREYTMMTMSDMPDIKAHMIESLDPVGPYGAKGVGEPTLIPMAPAIANAVEDAIGMRICELPITAEKIFFALNPTCDGGDLWE